MIEDKKQIESILHNYTTLKREVQVLEFELNRITRNLHPQAIEDRILAHSECERVSGSHHSDKTANIVIEHIDSQINGEYHALRTLISNIQIELQRIEYYLSLIPEKEAEVIRMFYFEKLTWAKITEKALNSQSTMQRLKNSGIEKFSKYYTILDKLDASRLDVRAKVRFISYIHEERFMQCLERVEEDTKPGAVAMLYIISGCNELWATDVEAYYDFNSGATLNNPDSKNSLSDNGQKLLELSYHLSNNFNRDKLVNILRYYFPGLEYVHLELAIEAVKLALFPEII